MYYTPNIAQKEFDITIIPHYTDYEDIRRIFQSQYNILDVRTHDIESFIKNIIASKFILSSSLHGLIFANAYGIPSLWFKHNYVNSTDFKYYDYFSSVELFNYKPIQLDLLKNKETMYNLFSTNPNVISSRKIIKQRQLDIKNSWNKLLTENSL